MGKGFTQAYDSDYTKRFSPIVCMNSICILLPLEIHQDQPSHHLEISNTFFYGDIEEKVLIDQPLEYIAKGKLPKFVFFSIEEGKYQAMATIACEMGIISTRLGYQEFDTYAYM